MEAFNNDEKLKEFYVNRMIKHGKTDELIQGMTWENGKGCFIGCSFHEYDQGKFEDLGLPIWLAKVADSLFEEQSNEDAKEFAVKFYPAINVGSDLDKIKLPFLAYVVESAYNSFDHRKHPEQEKAVKVILYKLKAGELPTKEERDNAAAYAAAYDVANTTAYAAAAAADAAANVNDDVAYAATAAADAAVAYDAYVAAYDAAATAAVAAATTDASNARRDKYKEFADELIRLMREEQAPKEPK